MPPPEMPGSGFSRLTLSTRHPESRLFLHAQAIALLVARTFAGRLADRRGGGSSAVLTV